MSGTSRATSVRASEKGNTAPDNFKEMNVSRSQYSDGCEMWDLIRWHGAVKSAICGKRGQAFLREMIAALDAMPEKILITDDLQNSEGVCALGSVGQRRGLDMSKTDPEARDDVAKLFGIAEAMAAEIMYENDDDYRGETPQSRWKRMRKWAEENLVAAVQP